MKLIQPQLVTNDATQRRQEADVVRHAVAVEAVERPRTAGSYASPSQRLPGHFVEQNHQAINSYLDTASLDADAGELIGVDTYA